MLDLNLLKWTKLDSIKYKTQFSFKNKNKSTYFNSYKRVYHSSCLVLNSDNLLNMKFNKKKIK